MKGRKPTPTALKILRGNPGHRPIDERTEPQPILGLGEPPAYLDTAAREHWFKLGPQLVQLRTLGESDASLFALLCQAHADNLWHAAQIARLRGMKSRGGKRENQLSIHESKRSKAAASYHKISAEFGLGAAARTRIKVTPDDGQGEFGFSDRPPASPLERSMALARSA